MMKRSRWSKLLVAVAFLGAASSQVKQVKAADTVPPTLYFYGPLEGETVTHFETQGSYKILYGAVTDAGSPISGVARVVVALRRYSDGYYWNSTSQSWTAASFSMTATLTSSDWVVNNGPTAASVTPGAKYLIAMSAVDNANNVRQLQRNVYGP